MSYAIGFRLGLISHYNGVLNCYLSEMKEQAILKRTLRLLPLGGIKAVSERSGFPRSTVVDCLSTYRPSRRIDANRIYAITAEFLRERGINFTPLNQLIK